MQSAADEHMSVGARPNVEAARELDQAGVRSFRDGRYVDAALYFRAAHDLGGPSSELWNIARCRERLDDAEGAAVALEDYLGRHDLAPQDRAGAQREAQALRARSSILTVTTTPSGATVTLDGKEASGQTPLSVEVPPGPHALLVRRDGYSVETRRFEARFGRAVIVSLDLARPHK
jgi:hypothetical protein